MSWHYQARRRRVKGESWYDVVEVYPRTRGRAVPQVYTIEGMRPESESLKGLIQVLQMMLKDVRKYRPIIEKETP